MVETTNPAIKKACDYVRVLNGDERERALAEAVEKTRKDREAWRDEAFAEGHAEGLLEERRRIAQNLLRSDLSHKQIAIMTDLPLDEIMLLSCPRE